jgi:Flp pilus assembly pilin Flp
MDWRSWGIWLRDERGQTAVEYAVVVAGVAIVLAVLLAIIPSDLFDGFWSLVTDKL